MSGRRGKSSYGLIGAEGPKVGKTSKTSQLWNIAVAALVIAIIAAICGVIGLIIGSVANSSIINLQEQGVKIARFEIGNNNQNEICISGTSAISFTEGGPAYDDAVNCLDADHQFVYGDRTAINTFYAPYDGTYLVQLGIIVGDPTGCAGSQATQMIVRIVGPNGGGCGGTTSSILTDGNYESVSCMIRLQQNQTVTNQVILTGGGGYVRIQDDSFFSIAMISPFTPNE